MTGVTLQATRRAQQELYTGTLLARHRLVPMQGLHMMMLLAKQRLLPRQGLVARQGLHTVAFGSRHRGWHLLIPQTGYCCLRGRRPFPKDLLVTSGGQRGPITRASPAELHRSTTTASTGARAHLPMPRLPELWPPHLQLPGVDLPEALLPGDRGWGLQLPVLHLPELWLPELQQPPLHLPGVWLPGDKGRS